MKSPHQGFKRIIQAFRYSYDGFKAIWHSEAAFRQELILCLLSLPFIILGPWSYLEKLILCTTAFAILAAEIINTAIEYLSDLISEDFHPLIKKAKDLGSLLVLLSFIYGTIIWILVIINQFH